MIVLVVVHEVLAVGADAPRHVPIGLCVALILAGLILVGLAWLAALLRGCVSPSNHTWCQRESKAR